MYGIEEVGPLLCDGWLKRTWQYHLIFFGRLRRSMRNSWGIVAEGLLHIVWKQLARRQLGQSLTDDLKRTDPGFWDPLSTQQPAYLEGPTTFQTDEM